MQCSDYEVKMELLSVLIFILIERTSAVIYRLNESEYYRMPPVVSVEPYERCISRPGGVYCSADLTVVSDTPSDLYTMMKEYSEHEVTHFNRTKLIYGVCVSKSCQEFNKSNKTDLVRTLEACLNQTLWDEYKLKARVSDIIYCDKYKDTKQIHAGDIVVAVLFIAILMINIVGSLYGIYYTKKRSQDNSWLLCFSVTHNWEKLVEPPNADPAISRFRGLNGMRALTMMLVILGHAFLPSALTAVNEYEFEQLYDNLGYQIFFNGTLIVQTFFVISGFLLMKKTLSHSEQHPISWKMIPKGIILRWLRLTPVYAVILAFCATWLRFGGSGPLWARIAEVEVKDCSRHWYYNLLFLNNYIDNSNCMAHTWYLACDMQLHILGLVILGIFHSSRARKIALGCLFTVGLMTPMVHTYFQDLNAVLLVTPTIMSSFFVTDPTFNNVYKRGHTNIVNFALGLITGWIVHDWQKKKLNEANFKKYRFGMWMLWPAMLTIVDIGAVFYMDRPPPPLLLRAVYSSMVKVSFGMCQVLMIMGCMFRVEGLYRGILEWRGWTTLARLSYCAYIVHIAIIRTLGGLKTTLTHVSVLQINMEVYGIISLALIIALPLWLMVESPMCQLVIILLNGKTKTTTKTDDNTKEPKSEEKKECMKESD